MSGDVLLGLPPLEAARCLARALGMDPSASPSLTPPHEPLLHHLAAHGLGGRVVRAGAEDVLRLPLPTLVQLQDDRWVLLHARLESIWVLEDEAGRRSRPLDHRELSGMVLERLPRLVATGGLWRRVALLVLEHRTALGQIALVSTIMQGFALVSPFVTRLVMDQALPEASGSLLALAVLGVLLATLAATALGLMRDWTSAFVETRLDAIARGGLLEHILRLPFRRLMGRTAGELLQAFTGISSAKDLLSQRLFAVTMDALTGLAYLGILVSLWPLGAGLTFLAGIVLALLGASSAILQARYQRQAVPAQIAERNIFAEMLRGIATLKTAGAEGRVFARWSDRYLRSQRLSLQSDRAGLLYEIGGDGTRQFLTLLLLLEGGRRMLSGELSPGTFFAFQQMSGMVMGAFQGASGLATSLYVMRPQLEKVHEILSLEPEPPPASLAAPDQMDLSVEDLWFRYSSEDAWVIKGLELRAEAGSRHWLRWASGAGKSTFLRLLAGLLEPERGQICIGGRPPKDVRDQLAYMPQGCQLYGASVLENLQILSGRASIDRIRAAAESSGLARLVATLPMGYETLLTQGGLNVSGGQRQLILLTAAMATERRLLLLDEAFSNLDWLSRSEILQGDWFQGKTVIYASHDAGLPKESPS